MVVIGMTEGNEKSPFVNSKFNFTSFCFYYLLWLPVIWLSCCGLFFFEFIIFKNTFTMLHLGLWLMLQVRSTAILDVPFLKICVENTASGDYQIL